MRNNGSKLNSFDITLRSLRSGPFPFVIQRKMDTDKGRENGNYLACWSSDHCSRRWNPECSPLLLPAVTRNVGPKAAEKATIIFSNPNMVVQVSAKPLCIKLCQLFTFFLPDKLTKILQKEHRSAKLSEKFPSRRNVFRLKSLSWVLPQRQVVHPAGVTNRWGWCFLCDDDPCRTHHTRLKHNASKSCPFI